MKRLLPALMGLCLLVNARAEKPVPENYLHPLFSDHVVLQRDMPVAAAFKNSRFRCRFNPSTWRPKP